MWKKGNGGCLVEFGCLALFNNYRKISTDTGTTTVWKDIPFKPKVKPAEGEHKKRRKSDMLKVVRAQDRQYAGKIIRPYFNSQFYQPRLAAVDRRLQETTLPDLKPTTWIPANKNTGAPGYTYLTPGIRNHSE